MKRPVVTIGTSRFESARGYDALSPARFPKPVAWDFSELSGNQVRSSLLDMDFRLQAGAHQVTLTRDLALDIEVAPDNHAGIHLVTGFRDNHGAAFVESDEDGGCSIVEGVDIFFSRPLVVKNVLGAILGAHTLFQNVEVHEFLQRLFATGTRLASDLNQAASAAGERFNLIRRLIDTASRSMPEMAGIARKSLDRLSSTLTSKVGEPVALEISSVIFKPSSVLDDSTPEGCPVLVPSISGAIVLSSTGARARFDDIVVPSLLLPRFNPCLDGVLRGELLVGGALKKDNIGGQELMKTVARMFGAFSGKFDADVRLPALAASWRQADRTDVSAEVWANEPVASVSAVFDVARDGTDAVVDVSSLSLGAPGSRRKFVGQASVRMLDVFMDGPGLPSGVTGWFRQKNRGSLPVINLKLSGRNPFLKSGNAVTLRIDELKSTGGIIFSVGPDRNPDFRLPDGELSLSSTFSLPEQCFGPAGTADIFGAIRRGKLKMKLGSGPEDGFDMIVNGRFPASFRVQTAIGTIPELNLTEGRVDISGQISAGLDLGFTFKIPEHGLQGLSLTPRGNVDVKLDSIKVAAPGQTLRSTAPTKLGGVVRQGVIAVGGEGDVAIDVCWELGSQQLELTRHGSKKIYEIPLTMTSGNQVVLISPGGRVSLGGSADSMLRPDILKALTSPLNNLGVFLDLLNDRDLFEGSLDVLKEVTSILNADISGRLDLVREWVARVRHHVREIGITRPGELFDEAVAVSMLSRMIVDDDSIVDEVRPIFLSLSSGQGLDMKAARMLILRHRPGFADTYEMDLILNWIDLMTRPGRLYERTGPVSLTPTVEEHAVQRLIADIPSAGEIYSWFDGRKVTPARVQRVVQLAPLMYIDQIEYILRRIPGTEFNAERMALQYAISAKRAIRQACGSDALGDLRLIPRASVLAGFLGDIIGPLPELDDDGCGIPCAALIGPRDVADILEVGLASPFQGVQSQLNNRLILEFLDRQDGDFFIAVLSELCRDVSITLALDLMSFFRQEQGRMARPFDVTGFFERKTGLKAPLFEDFQAGGVRARDSWFNELFELAGRVLAKAAPYRATKLKLRETVEPPTRPVIRTSALKDISRSARSLIAHAEDSSRRWLDGRRPSAAGRAKCVADWQAAFEACRGVLEIDPTAFTQPWLKDFWVRNEQAVRVAVGVGAFRDDLEYARPWLAHFDRSGLASSLESASSFGHRDQQRLIDSFVRTLWNDPADRDRIAADPLVRMLIEQENGDYDLNVVAAMGVITDGAHGREIEPAVQRLAARRGIGFRRVPTGMFRTLEYNARAIINEVSAISGPWAYIGYSQGCANCLRAEHIMMTGTPVLQEMASRLVCRNLLFSAANGSVHATSASDMFIHLLAEVEKSLKHYQATYSRDFVRMFLKTARGVLDSRVTTALLGGLWSMTFNRAIDLHRDGVFNPMVPTSTLRANVTPDELPDGLLYVYGMHRRLIPGEECDSQVATLDEIGHASRVQNSRTRVLESCDIGGGAIRMHHWGPVHDEALAGASRKDLENHKYESPADIYLFPWIDTNIRFGRIRKRADKPPKRR